MARWTLPCHLRSPESGWGWRLGQVSSVQEEQELGREQERRSFGVRDKGRGSQAADPSPGHKLHFAEEGILLAFQAEGAAVVVQEVP